MKNGQSRLYGVQPLAKNLAENRARLNAPLPLVLTHTSLVNSLDQDLTALLGSTLFAVPSGSFEL